MNTDLTSKQMSLISSKEQTLATRVPTIRRTTRQQAVSVIVQRLILLTL